MIGRTIVRVINRIRLWDKDYMMVIFPFPYGHVS